MADEAASWMKESIEGRPSAWTYEKKEVKSLARGAAAKKVREVNKRLRDIYEESGMEYGADVELDELGERFHMAKNLRKKSIKNVFKKIRLAKNVDLCFLIDVTGSMQTHIDEVKRSIQTIVESLKTPAPISGKIAHQIRLAVVGYRDFSDAKQFEVLDFSESVETFQAFCADLKATGGGDTTEDVFGGLEQALSLQWSPTSLTKIIFHIADAPCHGRKYHDLDDTPSNDAYPQGDPKGRTETGLFDQMACKNIDYHFGKITDHTNKMIKVFTEAYGEEIIEFDIKNVADFTKSVVFAVSQSVFASIASSTLISRISKRQRNYTLVKDMPVWDGRPSLEGRFLTYELPDSIQNVIEDVPLTRNPPKKAIIKIAENPFAHGAERYAFYGKDLSIEPHTSVVLKEYLHVGHGMNTAARYETTNQIQTIAAFFAIEYTAAIKEVLNEYYQLKFLKVKTLAIDEKRAQIRYLSCESQFSHTDTFVRFTNNTNYEIIESQAEKYKIKMDFVRYLMAFSHWTYQVTEGYMMIVDLQGIVKAEGTRVKVILTDPAIHCLDETRFGRMNLGKGGMMNFFEKHQCNDFCKALKLNPVKFDDSDDEYEHIVF